MQTLESNDGRVLAKVSGRKAGHLFRHESGKHCVQRVPSNDPKGRMQTSMVSVGVLPVRDYKVDELRDDDLEVQTQRGHGPGGQNVNKVNSSVRIYHKPTGTTVRINGRDQGANKRKARKILEERIAESQLAEQKASYDSQKRAAMGDGGRSDKVRTYNYVRQEVKDSRLGTKTNLRKFQKGDFSDLF